MSPLEIYEFKSILKANRDKLYVEYGSGGSTLIANGLFKKFYSMDTDKSWVELLNSKLGKNKVKHVDVGDVGYWGFPKECNANNFNKIVHCFDEIIRENSGFIVFIDGRARASTAINIVNLLSCDDIVMIHDFTYREYYYDVLKYYSIISVYDTLVILRKNDKKLEILEYDFR